MDQLRSLPSFSRTIDRQNLRSLSQISSDLQIIFVALNSFSSSSKFLQKFLKPCLEELIWPDENLVFENKILDLDLIQLVQDRLRCIRSEMVASGWRRESQEINSTTTTAVTNSQENEKEQLEKSTSSSSSSLATLICWMLSFIVYFEEAKFYLKERILPQIKRENAKGNDLMIEIKWCLVSVFVEMQSMILAATEISKSFRQKKYEDIFHLVLEIQLSISSSNVEYYNQQQQQTSNSSNGISELATANKNALESWKMLSPFHQSATKDDLPLELKEFKNEIDEFLSKLLKTNQLFQICFASEIGFPAIFRPAPGDENLAKKKLIENEIL
jgi:hypothetical protein